MLGVVVGLAGNLRNVRSVAAEGGVKHTAIVRTQPLRAGQSNSRSVVAVVKDAVSVWGFILVGACVVVRNCGMVPVLGWTDGRRICNGKGHNDDYRWPLRNGYPGVWLGWCWHACTLCGLPQRTTHVPPCFDEMAGRLTRVSLRHGRRVVHGSAVAVLPHCALLADRRAPCGSRGSGAGGGTWHLAVGVWAIAISDAQCLWHSVALLLWRMGPFFPILHHWLLYGMHSSAP